MKTLSVILVLALLFACSKSQERVPNPAVSSDVQKEQEYKKELDEIRKNLNGDIKIQLKKDGKGDFYSWEISGKDASDVLKANDILERRLGKRPVGP